MRPEVLAPAGDMEKLRAALLYGADAVYLGGKSHTMRSGAGNFGPEELAEGVRLAHAAGARVYFTCNTLPVNEELPSLGDYLRAAARAGVDAFIVSDIGVMMEARRVAPEVEIHVSTQAGVTNWLTARELYRLGARRVILARELDLEAIRGIRENTPPELALEVFVHGAMCMSFSGRCLLSNYLLGRDANRGECAQPCRWKYALMEEKRPGQYFPVFEGEEGSYILNARDLCLIGHLDKLAQAGVSSFKIEGRSKSAYYTAVATNAYKSAVELLARDPGHYALPAWLEEEPRKVSHREYCEGFLFGRPEEGQCFRSSGYLRPWDVAAVVQGWEDGVLRCAQRNKVAEGEELEALLPGGVPPIRIAVEDLRDGEGNPIPSTPHPTMAFTFRCPQPLPEGVILRREKKE